MAESVLEREREREIIRKIGCRLEEPFPMDDNNC